MEEEAMRSLTFDAARSAGRRGDTTLLLDAESIAGWCHGTYEDVMAAIPRRLWPAQPERRWIDTLILHQVLQHINDRNEAKAKQNGET